MGHGWIQRRLPKATGELEAKKVGKADYTRHVLFFSIPQAVAHAEALIKLIAKQDVSADFHAAHEVTREWGDAAIDKVVDNRAGLEGAARKR